MFRKILIAVVASLTLLSPLALPTQSEAREVHRGRVNVHYRGHARSCYRVYYRGCAREAWRFSCEYGSRDAAWRAANQLHARGFEISVR